MKAPSGRLHGLVVFAGAFLLFQIQPLIGKYLLPWFGGGPSVWTTCLLFFEVVLLAGYGYAHGLAARFPLRTQAIVHTALLVAAVACLPIVPSDAWKAHLGGDPVVGILMLLTVCIGLPYLVLSATGPLVQHWFSVIRPGESPYRLYALSNAGSLLALLSYPAYFERELSRRAQATWWSCSWVVFVGCCAYLAWRVGREATTIAPSHPEPSTAPRPAPLDRLLWVALPTLASALLLATTNKICQEVAVIPLLWILPLGLYLSSFVLCFDHPRWYRRDVFGAFFTVAIVAVLFALFKGNRLDIESQIAIYGATLFVACMVCHGEVYRLRPDPRFLTGYFFAIAAGGAIGGLSVSVVAPAVLDDYRELQIGLWMLSVVLAAICVLESRRDVSPWILRATGMSMIVLCIGSGIAFLLDAHRHGDRRVISATRNFYGALKVVEHDADDPEKDHYLLLSGATKHGLQRASFPALTWPTTYYGPSSGVALAIRHLAVPSGHRRIGLVGLGVGTLAAYAEPGDALRIYEINPAVRAAATTRFSYLARSAAAVTIVMGDARLSMERELANGDVQRFDLLALDAFNGDAIPVHLLTVEAVALYLRHLTPGGILAIHTSNRYLDLVPVVDALSRHFQLAMAVVSDPGSDDWWIESSTWVLLSADRTALVHDDIANASAEADPDRRPVPMWTDDRASLIDVLR